MTKVMKSSCTWGIVAVASLLSACTDTDSPGGKKATLLTDWDALTIEQSACLFDCPVFKVNIFLTGACVIPVRPSSLQAALMKPASTSKA